MRDETDFNWSKTGKLACHQPGNDPVVTVTPGYALDALAPERIQSATAEPMSPIPLIEAVAVKSRKWGYP